MKSSANKKNSQHAGWMIRLPGHLRGPMEEVIRRTRRTRTTEVVIAIEKHLADMERELVRQIENDRSGA